jgi:dipeptidyl aminopeptidase/acylaminoacyl peptidase
MTIAPYGSWRSPIDAQKVVAAGVSLSEPAIDGDSVYWLEARPTEAGRAVIVAKTGDNPPVDLLPAPWNSRNRVHEYGGASYAVRNGMVIFSNDADGRLYRVDGIGAEPKPLTPDTGQRALRYASIRFDPVRDRILAIREDHRGAGEAVNTLVAISLASGDDEGTILVSGHDFFGPIEISPDGSRVAWTEWDHPRMPWDGTTLKVADVLPDGTLGEALTIAGSETESVVQPGWLADGSLIFTSDRTEWWNLYRWQNGAISAITNRAAEYSYPQWRFNMHYYAITGPTSLVAASGDRGHWSLEAIDVASGTITPIPAPYVEIDNVNGGSGRVAFIGGAPDRPAELAIVEAATGKTTVLQRSSTSQVNPAVLSLPEQIEFPTENGLTAFAYYYAPRNAEFSGPEGSLPPLVVLSHGGPTGATSAALTSGIQYWTSRGFAVVDVDYGGSCGYGRPYRERLRDSWGIVDIDDCVNAAKFLIARGDVDGDRVMIRGWSASGYTTLAALTFRDFFKAGASHFGVSDLETMAADTHKFESRYLDGLIGPYPAARDIYLQRSPIHAVDNMNCPLILFQGLEDKVVPPDQAELMFEAVKAKGLPVAYVPFEGEQHGFRQEKNIVRSYEAELYFLSRVFNFPLPDPIEPVEIANESALPR